jgi:DNA-directed RNA polymerase sigma subunit (sigma70/sigma32)
MMGGQPSQKSHWDFLIKEMKWMAEDFERETKKKVGDAKKNVRVCRKQLHEKKLKKEREAKDMKHEVKKRAQNTSRMIQHYWKSVEKVVKHNHNVLYEKKRQAQRTKRLESFVSKHLKLSVKVAE